MPQPIRAAVRACLIANPRSGQGDLDLSEALAVLRANDWEVVVREKQDGGEATKLARAAAESGCDVVVGCGGDGTLSEIVDGLAGSDVAVGAIPGGTVNLWAGELGISDRPRVAAQQLVTAERRRADLGHLEINGHHGRHFLLMAGIGFDGAVIERISKPLKRRIGGPAVWLAALRALPAVRSASVQIDLDGVNWTGTLSQIVAGNTRRYGGFARITPAARVNDARLDLCLFTATSPAQACRQAASLLLRGKPSLQSAEEYRAARILIQSPVLLPVQVDGGRVSLKHVAAGPSGVTYLLTARPAAITVLVPSTYGGSLFQHSPAISSLHMVGLKHRGPDRDQDAPPVQVGNDSPDGKTAEKRRRLRVMSVGVDTITGIVVKNGRALTVLIDPAAVAKDSSGERQPLATFLASLREGDLLRAKGSLDEKRGLLIARRLRLADPDSKQR